MDRVLRDQMRAEMRRLEAFTYGKALTLLREEAWRCLFCSTINGPQSGSNKVIKKTCTKCRKPRTNLLTVKEELLKEAL